VTQSQDRVANKNRATCVGRIAYASLAVVAVEGGSPSSVKDLALADPARTVGVHPLHSASNQLFEHLRVARRIHRVHQERRRDAAGRHGYAVAIAVVLKRHFATVLGILPKSITPGHNRKASVASLRSP